MATVCAMGVSAQEQAKTTWAETLSLKGDLRVRFESIDEEGKDQRDRARYRARLGAYAAVNDEVDAAFALASGEDDPVSTNQTLGQGFSSKPVRIDLAYINLHPELIGGNAVILGKMKMPFMAVNDLIWDTDLNPEGAAFNTSFGEDALKVDVNAGSFWVEERSSENEAMLYGAQAAVASELQAAKVTAGASYYLYEGIQGYAPVFDETDSFGNSVNEDAEGALTYANGYELVELFAKLGIEAGLPIEFSASHVVNQEVDSNDTGYMLGVKAGKLKDPGSYEVGYSYKELEADAVLGAFTDSDAFGGGTDGTAHKITLGYQIAKNLAGNAAYSICEKGIENGIDYNRFQIDLNVKF